MRTTLKLFVAISATSMLAMLAAQIGPATAATPLAKGNVLLSIGGGKVDEYTPTGTLVKTLDSTTGTTENDGMCFDSSGNLYSTNGFTYGSVAKFDDTGTLVNKDFIPPASTQNGHPESCVVNSAGNIFVGLPDHSPTVVQEYSSSGALINTFPVTAENRGSDWLDLAKDQCTLYYTSEGDSLFRYNVCTKTQLTPLTTTLPGDCFAHRLLADGTILVACEANVVHLSSTGAVLKTFTAASLGDSGGFLFAMNIDPDGKTFWTADYDTGLVIHANISDGTVVNHFTHSGDDGPYGGLAVVGELTQSIPSTTTTSTTSTTVPATTTTAPPAVAATPAFTG
jgi:hypothetical protein